MTADEFKAGIRAAIDTILDDTGHAYWHDDDGHPIGYDGPIDTADIADLVHQYVVNRLTPPFAPTNTQEAS